MEENIENYQLKWHSFGTYFNSCISSALDVESFADVILLTIDGHEILAHRFILSICSQYLQHVLKLHTKFTSTLPLIIILPPEIDYKTLKTLIQYMYSGEVTVPKDMLESVLKGGDLLKIKGLWRPNNDNNENILNFISNDEIDEKKQNCKINIINNRNEKNENNKLLTGKNVIIKRSDDSKIKHQQDEITINANEDSSSSQFLIIKEEPIEWNETEKETVVVNTELMIKPEIFIEENQDTSSQIYSPLTCELCLERFNIPAEWVRHVQTHTDMLPAKRQKRGKLQSSQDESDAAPFPPLHCDLCQKYFTTPGEWVRHIQDTHTEFELHLSNKCAPGKVVKNSQQLLISPSTQNCCSVCSKRFPSHASLLIHKRTHTGEKPYMCDTCSKGFNVKSNLLRHLRTVHDKIMNPAEIDKEDV